MFNKKMKIEINDNFNMIMNYINSQLKPVVWKELIQYCIDYDLYMEFYINLNVWKILIEEKNKEFVVEVQKDIFPDLPSH